MITLSKSGNTVTFTFDENSGYLQNGTIDVPVNSLSLIIDESDMATFRKSASNDIFISARYEEFGMSKAELEAWYKANMVSSGGGGGTGGTTPEEVQQMIDQSISGKQDTMIAGRGISITTGETADTVSFNLPIYSGNGENSIVEGSGNSARATGEGSHAEGSSIATGMYAHAEGESTSATGLDSHSEGYHTLAAGSKSHAEGSYTIANNDYEHACGYNNVSTTSYSTYERTLFSVGNGTSRTNRHNAFEIKANGDIYLTSGNTDIKLQDALGAGGVPESAFTAYTAATDSRLAEDEEVSARALNDLDEKKLDASAYTPVDLSDYYTTAQTDSKIAEAVSGKQDTLVSGTNIKTINNISLLGSGNIDIQGGGGTGGCTVEETVVYETYIDNYNYQPDGDKYEYVILDNHNDKTTDVRDIYFTIGDDSNNYAEGYIRFDYPNHSASTTDESNTALTEYTTIEYISDINDFKVSVASGYQATNWFKTISNLFNISIIVPFYTINSGSPCTVIETDVVGLVEKVKDVADKSVSDVSLTSQKNRLDLNCNPNKGHGNNTFVRLDELDGSNNTLRPDIKIPLGVSGWTELSITSDTCNVYDINAINIRVTYDYETFNADYMYITIVSDTDGWEHYDNVSFSWETELPTFYSDYFTGVTISWSAATKELVVEYPPTVDDGGIIKNVKISRLGSSNCQFGQTINKVETYGELKQDLKPYVQETKAALGGLSLVKLTQAEYDALSPNYDSNTLYVIVN